MLFLMYDYLAVVEFILQPAYVFQHLQHVSRGGLFADVEGKPLGCHIFCLVYYLQPITVFEHAGYFCKRRIV
jgi:hypothetical protein